MTIKLLKTALIWGFVLWLIGYILGIVLFAILPPSIIGWVIMPIGILITLWILFKKVNFKTVQDYLVIGIVWTLIAIICDYFLLVKLFNPADGYYKLDVYIYYLVTFSLPVIVGWLKTKHA